MVSTYRSFGLIVVVLGITGCSVLPQTTVEVIHNDTSMNVDTTQVPEEWLERSVWQKRIGKTHTIRVKPGNLVKVILVPDEAGQAGDATTTAK
ncbi:MAG: hypothetical protein M3478_15815 [Planctomycetota bacterium]|nr:hypothetical protein [Planctomycetota bacterium]